MPISVSQLRNKLAEILGRAAYAGERIVIASRGKPKAAIIGIEDLELLQDLEDAQAAREALEAHRRGDTIPWEEIKAELAEERP
jgi:prevent-host-death family protein